VTSRGGDGRDRREGERALKPPLDLVVTLLVQLCLPSLASLVLTQLLDGHLLALTLDPK
jgi:hypothetical protein